MNSLHYRYSLTSVLAVTQEVTQTRWRSPCREFRTGRTKWLPVGLIRPDCASRLPKRDVVALLGLLSTLSSEL
jgi:hypothetical protein